MMERKGREKKSLSGMEETVAGYNAVQNMDGGAQAQAQGNSVEELNRTLETEFAAESAPTEAAQAQTAPSAYNQEFSGEVAPGFASTDAQRLHEAYRNNPENPANNPEK